ncbi:MAG: Fic family protein [Ignavibacteriales bacterium]|nr:Fic family protein [Ignavibacteriales bacterium]
MSFDPTYPHNLNPLPPRKKIANSNFGDLLLHARVELAELKGACLQIPNPMLLMMPSMLRESVASSNIENINTTLTEVLQWQLFPESERREPDKEVLRYREAMEWGNKNVQKYALSTRLISGIHSRLIPDGSGQYRRVQNQIANLSTGKNLYTPPIANAISPLISNWEEYVNRTGDALDPLIRTIIAHYQFEAIHPFTDGNGRAVLYISGYINKHRAEYYRRLLAVTTDEKWEDFISYMLEGFFIQAKETHADLKKITSLFDTTKEQIRNKNKKIYSAELVEAIFTYPIISPTKLAATLSMHYTTTSKYLLQLTEMGILKEATVGKYHLFANHQLLRILNKQS